MELTPLFTLTGTAVVEKVGKVQDGERIKIEFRGKSAVGSPIEGKAHGSSWVLIGPLGPGATNAVQEVITPGGERVVLELQGYTMNANGKGMEIRTCGIIRSSAASYADLNGRIALAIQKVGADDAVTIDAYRF